MEGGGHPAWLTGQPFVAAAIDAAPAQHSEPHRVARRGDMRRAEILRELLGYLEQLPNEDLEKLRSLARARAAEPLAVPPRA